MRVEISSYCSLVRFWAVLVLVSCGREGATLPHSAPVADAGAKEGEPVGSDTLIEASADDVSGSPTPTGDSASEAGPTCEICPAYGSPVHVGAIPTKLVELSGLAASRLHPGILYAHNDSGDIARFFAINDKAQITAEMDLTGATAIDWEDMAVGPCPSGSCVYLGDIGDNGMTRPVYTIYRVAEPAVLATDGSASPVTYERFPFVYPDGKHNAETLLVHPSGRIFVVVKVMGVAAGVYEMPSPLMPDAQVTLQPVTTVSLGASGDLIAGGSFHPCGGRLLLRTYGELYELIAGSDGGVEGVFQATPVRVPVAQEVQGEAVTYSLDGKTYFTSSETVANLPAQLSHVGCP